MVQHMHCILIKRGKLILSKMTHSLPGIIILNCFSNLFYNYRNDSSLLESLLHLPTYLPLILQYIIQKYSISKYKYIYIFLLHL